MSIRILVFICAVLLCFGCSKDDCPDEIIIDINDPGSIQAAEDCGLSPAEPIGENLWLWTY